MDDIIELIVELLFAPFESKVDESFGKIKRIRHKGLRILLGVLLAAILLAIIFGLFFLIRAIFNAIWK